MESFPLQLKKRLAERSKQGLTRNRKIISSPQGTEVLVNGSQLLSFCSNDYLGLANHPELVAAFKKGADLYGVGSGASHLVSGHSKAHHALEEELADFTGRSKALTFSSGFMTNVGVLTTLASKNDQIYQDKLNHASLLDGGLFSGARFRRYPHLDTAALEKMLHAKQKQGNTFIVSDGVFSMDGDKAPVPELIKISDLNQAQLIIDDAHGFGCLGKNGGGLIEEFQQQGVDINENNLPVLIGTFGKAFACSGAFVAGSEELVETLIQYCRPYIYTTAMPPALAEAIRCSLKIVSRDGWRREYLQELISRFRQHCQVLGFKLTASATPIQALLLEDTDLCMRASQFLQDQGIMLTAIRPPTVPPGTDRLRITFNANHTEEQFQCLLSALEKLAELVRQEAANE